MRRQGRVRSWGVAGEQRVVGPEFSFLRVNPENIEPKALKVEHEDWGQFSPFIIRLYETKGVATQAALELAHSVRFVEETDHLERPLEEQNVAAEGRRVSLTFAPHEIKTLRLAFFVPSFGVHEEGDEEHVTLTVPEESDRFEGQ